MYIEDLAMSLFRGKSLGTCMSVSVALVSVHV